MSTKIKQIKSNLPTVVLFGRTNVGKSTLFNKLVGGNKAMVTKIAGTTRDTNHAVVDWQDKQFELIDTGGILEPKILSGEDKVKKLNLDKNNIDVLVQLQARKYLKQADYILFIVDNKDGLLKHDKEMVLLLKRIVEKKKNIVLVVNKVDNPKERAKTAEFYKLALGDPLLVSATNGTGTGDLLDYVCAKLPKIAFKQNSKEIKVVILGQPNVGKSSLINAIVGEEKVIVSEQAHTTREPQDMVIEYNKQAIRFIDTAGIVKNKSKMTKQQLIKRGIAMSLTSLKHADIALLVLDITKDISHHETKLVSEILEDQINIIIVANKWDAIDDRNHKQYQTFIKSKFPFIAWAPIIFLSAKNKTKINQLIENILISFASRNKKINEEELKEFLKSSARHATPLSNTKVRGIMKHKMPKPKLIRLEQTYVNPVEFTLTIKSKFGLKDNYLKYLENRLRDKFELVGTPIRIIIRHKL